MPRCLQPWQSCWASVAPANRVKRRRFSRRYFLAAAVLSAPLMGFGEARWLEPKWIKVRRVRIGAQNPTHRIVHLTDIHHKGDRDYLGAVVEKVNQLSPDFVCFTGDLIEEPQYLAEALEILARIKCPIYGVPGNHDYWSKAPFQGISECFARTGGAWLEDQQAVTADGKFTIFGATCLSAKQPGLSLSPATRNLFLMHYPAWVKRLHPHRFDLILAGHSHGGQFRIPFWGAIMLPFGVDEYDLGLFHTPRGPLYVNAGIGWFPVAIRFNCRPEITCFEL